jgi:hypothetical protein
MRKVKDIWNYYGIPDSFKLTYLPSVDMIMGLIFISNAHNISVTFPLSLLLFMLKRKKQLFIVYLSNLLFVTIYGSYTYKTNRTKWSRCCCSAVLSSATLGIVEFAFIKNTRRKTIDLKIMKEPAHHIDMIS